MTFAAIGAGSHERSPKDRFKVCFFALAPTTMKAAKATFNTFIFVVVERAVVVVFLEVNL